MASNECQALPTGRMGSEVGFGPLGSEEYRTCATCQLWLACEVEFCLPAKGASGSELECCLSRTGPPGTERDCCLSSKGPPGSELKCCLDPGTLGREAECCVARRPGG